MIAMKTGDKEICGTFKVETEDKEIATVLVIQENHQHYSKDKSYPKSYCLDRLEGDPVYPTEDPDTFKLANGERLKRKKHRTVNK